MDLNVVKVKWNHEQSGIWWNETCAMILEKFGLPGNKYITKSTEDDMDFVFNNVNDATMCRIYLSERL